MINYKEEVFIRSYLHEDDKLYGAFHPEVVMNKDHYDATGRYLVVLLHPTKGLQTFYMNKADGTNSWQMEESSGAIVEDDLLEWCSNQIVAQKQ